MAKLILLTGGNLISRNALPGDEFDTVAQAVDIASLQASGAVFAPKELAGAAALKANALKGRGANALDNGSLGIAMLGAMVALGLAQSFELTLVLGTQSKSDTLTIGPNSVAVPVLKTHAGTAGARYRVALVEGGPGTGSVTVTAVDAAGALVNTDLSTLRMLVVG